MEFQFGILIKFSRSDVYVIILSQGRKVSQTLEANIFLCLCIAIHKIQNFSYLFFFFFAIEQDFVQIQPKKVYHAHSKE